MNRDLVLEELLRFAESCGDCGSGIVPDRLGWHDGQNEANSEACSNGTDDAFAVDGFHRDSCVSVPGLLECV